MHKFFKKKSACQCRGHGFDPWSGKIPHVVEQLSPCATTTEARAHSNEDPMQPKEKKDRIKCQGRPKLRKEYDNSPKHRRTLALCIISYSM